MGQLGQTITVINKSGVVVKNVSPSSRSPTPPFSPLTLQLQSKQLINVFKEAKNAYREKKAELKAHREADYDEKQARHKLKHLHLEDNVSRSSSRHRHHHDRDRGHESPRSSTSHAHRQHRDDDSYYARPPMERGYTDSFYAGENAPINPDLPYPPPSGYSQPRRIEQDLAGNEFHRHELTRRHTEGDIHQGRRSSDPHIDMDLAYGELPPPLPARHFSEEQEFRGKMTHLTRMLEEAHAMQHSATATIEHLQKNPDAMAAVALTLAEASSLASKLAPGALAAMKGSFPAAMALLASPQFLIAVGLGVGVTVVMLGGWKIVKRIKEQKAAEKELEEPIRLQELEPELSRVEIWRRGIADVEAESVGTSVDGEFITPVASRRLIQEGTIRPEDIREPSDAGRTERSERSERRRRESKDARSHHKSRRGDQDDGSSRAGSERSSRSRKDKEKESKRKAVVKGVKMLFMGKSIPESEKRRRRDSSYA
jgi:hypothetical protein